jgi:hypothetical protein
MAELSLLCNQCGSECRLPAGPTGSGSSLYGLIDASFTTGYFSEVLDDCERFTFSLCEPCVKALMLGFKLPASRVEIGAGDPSMVLGELPPLGQPATSAELGLEGER